MVAIFGDLEPRDDYTHRPGAEENFNESTYYNFFDRDRDVGGFVRLGNRVNEGYAEMSLLVFLPGGPVLFSWARPEITSNDGFNAGGMRFEVLQPFVRHRTLYEGNALYLQDPYQMADPGRAFSQNPHKQVNLDLAHEALGPVYGSTKAYYPAAPAHYEQHMQVRGFLAVDGETIEIGALGMRDHSWGPRYWQEVPYSRWLSCTFSHEFGIMVLDIAKPDGSVTREGVVVRSTEELDRITSLELRSEFEAGTRYHRGMVATIGLENGEQLALEGKVKRFIPLRNRRAGRITLIGEGMTEYRCGGHVALGISEYVEQQA
jgi:hypothetical protein